MAHAGTRSAAHVGAVAFTLASALVLGVAPERASADIPATPLMTVYQFDGPLGVPYYRVAAFREQGPKRPAGTLAQGSAVVPCLVVHGGVPLTDASGTPFVGFSVVVDAAKATAASSAVFAEVLAQRREMRVTNHHCAPGTEFVIDVRRLHPLGKAPSFDPPRRAVAAPASGGGLDAIVRAFHESAACAEANLSLVGRREGLKQAWARFAAAHQERWPRDALERARQFDLVMRTVLYEGHLGRGCSAYAACERKTIALSIRNRAVVRCLRGQGCGAQGDFEGVATKTSQYNIWDEVLTQTTGLTSCFLRADLGEHEFFGKLQAMYAQSATDVARILFGNDNDRRRLFPGSTPEELGAMRHYYHPPAMGKCFPASERLEYMSGAVAARGGDFALIANTRIRVGAREENGYRFRLARIEVQGERDIIHDDDAFPGFIVDARKVALAAPSRCTPYGTPRSCRHESVGRHRRTPPWLASGRPMQLACRVQASGESCSGNPTAATVHLGGICDTQMQPIAGVP